MDKIRIILSALAARAPGSASGATATARADLESRLRRLFADSPRATRALEDYLEDPDTYERPLAKSLLDSRVDRDESILAAASALLDLDAPSESAVLQQVAERERLRTGDRFTRAAQDTSEAKALDTEASRQRMERLWEEERQRLAQVAEQQARRRRQERQLLLGALLVALVIIAVFMAIALASAPG